MPRLPNDQAHGCAEHDYDTGRSGERPPAGSSAEGHTPTSLVFRIVSQPVIGRFLRNMLARIACVFVSKHSHVHQPRDPCPRAYNEVRLWAPGAS